MSFEFESTLEQFMQVMRDKLNENQHKPRWDGDTIEWLMMRLKEETQELVEAIDFNEPPRNVARECADIANFAMMIADVSKGLTP